MTIKEFFQNLGQNIGQGWAALKNRIFSHQHAEYDDLAASNPLLEQGLSEASDSSEYVESTAVMTGRLIDVSDPAIQPVSDLDANPDADGIVKYAPTFGQRVSLGASKVVTYASSLFGRHSEQDAENHAWVDRSESGSKKGFVALSDDADTDTKSVCKII